MTGKKLKKDTKKSVSNTVNNQPIVEETSSINNGRTVILRDNLGELVLSSTHDEDTFPVLLSLANTQKLRQIGILPPTEQNGKQGYIG
jgi:hypothetical protein